MSWVALKTQLDSMEKVVVRARQKHVKEFRLLPPSLILWEFCTEARDIGFEVVWEDHRSRLETIHSHSRVKSHCLSQCGHYIPRTPGKIRIIWDNSYSKLNSKELYYQIHVVKGKTPTLRKHAKLIEKDLMAVDTVHSLWEVAVEMHRQRDNLHKSKVARTAFFHALSALTPEQRISLWLIDSRALYRYCQLSTTYYADLLSELHTLPKTARRAIERDSTASSLREQMSLTEQGIACVQRLLQALALRIKGRAANPTPGYKASEGLQYVAAGIVSALSCCGEVRENTGHRFPEHMEEIAFLLLCAWVDRSPYFSSNGPLDDHLLHIDCLCLQRVLAQQIPAINYHIQRHKIQLKWLITPMLQTSFAQSLPDATLHRLWDFHFMVASPLGQFASILAFFQNNQKELLRTGDYNSTMKALSSASRQWKQKGGSDSLELLELSMSWHVRLSLKKDIEQARKSIENDSDSLNDGDLSNFTMKDVSKPWNVRHTKHIGPDDVMSDSGFAAGEFARKNDVRKSLKFPSPDHNFTSNRNSEDTTPTPPAPPQLQINLTEAEKRASYKSTMRNSYTMNDMLNELGDEWRTGYNNKPNTWQENESGFSKRNSQSSAGEQGEDAAWVTSEGFTSKDEENYYNQDQSDTSELRSSEIDQNQNVEENWKLYWDEEKQLNYYANSVTNEKYWESEVWTQGWDEASNHSYYWNWVTKESKWSRPDCLPPPAADATATENNISPSTETELEEKNEKNDFDEEKEKPSKASEIRKERRGSSLLDGTDFEADMAKVRALLPSIKKGMNSIDEFKIRKLAPTAAVNVKFPSSDQDEKEFSLNINTSMVRAVSAQADDALLAAQQAKAALARAHNLMSKSDFNTNPTKSDPAGPKLLSENVEAAAAKSASRRQSPRAADRGGGIAAPPPPPMSDAMRAQLEEHKLEILRLKRENERLLNQREGRERRLSGKPKKERRRSRNKGRKHTFGGVIAPRESINDTTTSESF
eukprot:g4787.t1